MTKDELANGFKELASNDVDGALALATGIFVGLVEACVAMNGEDPKREIKIESGRQRDITLHEAE